MLGQLSTVLDVVALDWYVDVLFLCVVDLIDIVWLLLMKVAGTRSLHHCCLIKTTLKRYVMDICRV